MKEKNIKKNAALNVIKQCTGAIFPLVTYPYISRTIGSDGFGRVSFADSFVSILIFIALLGIPVYAVREGSRIRDDREKFKVFSNEMFTISALSLLVSAAIIVLCVLFVPRVRLEAVLIIVLSIDIIASVLGRDWINNVYEDFAYISLRYVISHLIGVALIFIFVKNKDDLYVYALILAFTFSAGLFLNVFYTRRYAGFGLASFSSLKKHIAPILGLFSTTIAVKIYVSSDVLMVGFFRNNAEVGVYSLASKVYIIIKLLFNAIIATAIPRLANYLGKSDKNKHRDTLDSLKKFLLIFLFPAIAGLIMLSKETLYILGGEDFISGYKCIVLLSVALYAAVMANYYANAVLVPLRKEKIFIMASVIAAVLNITLNIFMIQLIGIEGAAITTVIAEFIVMNMCLYASKGYVDKPKLKFIIGIILGTVAVVVCCAVIKMFIASVIMRVILSIVLSVILYSAIIYAFRLIPNRIRN